MKAFKNCSLFLSAVLLAYFLIPYFIFLRYFNLDFNFDYQELWWAFRNSSLQAFFAATIVTLLGIPLSLGLLTLTPRWSAVTRKLLLIPQVLPALFSILIAFSLLEPFPMGTVGIIIIFVFMHLGFAAVLLLAGTQEKLGPFALVSEIFAIRKVSFWSKVYFPLMRGHLLTTYVLIFIFCFASFSVPLVAGGGRGTNLEVLIYEKIFINQNWSIAWSLNLIQSVFIFILSFFILQTSKSSKVDFENSRFLKLKWGIAGLIIYLTLYGGGYLLGLIRSIGSISQLVEFAPELRQATLRSLSILLSFILASILLLVLWIYNLVLNGKQSGARHLLATSTILVGFSFYLIFPNSNAADYLKIVLAMTILYFPVLFRGFLEKPIEQLQSQILTAKIFRLSTSRIVFTIILSQMKRPLFLWLSFLMIWFLSDFAILKSLGIQNMTLGLMAASFLNGYRLSLAYLLSFYIILLWASLLGMFYFAMEVSHVTHSKPKA